MYGFGKTDKGSLRRTNQDFIYINNNPIGALENLYIVADGIGGHNAGEIASQKSIEFFVEYIKQSKEKHEILDNLIEAMNYSNSKIFNLGKEIKEYQNMGTTLLAVTIKNEKIFIAHVGDSRLYGIRNNKIAQMTTDHTYANYLFKAGEITLEETENIPQRHILTRALGTDKNIQADALFCDLLKDDIFIICSDGLNTMLTNEEILKIVTENINNGESAVDILIKKANENGGKDNIAVIIIK